MTKRKPPANGLAKKRMKAEIPVAVDLEIPDFNAVEEDLASSGSGANEADKNKLPPLSESQKEGNTKN